MASHHPTRVNAAGVTGVEPGHPNPTGKITAGNRETDRRRTPRLALAGVTAPRGQQRPYHTQVGRLVRASQKQGSDHTKRRGSGNPRGQIADSAPLAVAPDGLCSTRRMPGSGPSAGGPLIVAGAKFVRLYRGPELGHRDRPRHRRYAGDHARPYWLSAADRREPIASAWTTFTSRFSSMPAMNKLLLRMCCYPYIAGSGRSWRSGY